MKRNEMKKMLGFIEAKYDSYYYARRPSRQTRLFEQLLSPHFERVPEDYNMGPLNGAISFVIRKSYQNEIGGEYSDLMYFKEMGRGVIRIWNVEEIYEESWYDSEIDEFVEIDKDVFSVISFADIKLSELRKVIDLSARLAEKEFTDVQFGTPDEIQDTIKRKKERGAEGTLSFSPKRIWDTAQNGSVTIFEKHVYCWWELSRQYDMHEKVAFCPYGKEAELFDLV